MPDTVDVLLPPGSDLPPCDQRLGVLYSYWLSIRPAPDLLPGRQHFNPSDVPQLLQWIWLAEVHRDPLRFKYRLVGTGSVEAIGLDLTGRWFDEAHPRFRESPVYPHFVAVAERTQVALYRGHPVYIDKILNPKWKTLERLILPLALNGRDVGMLLGITTLAE